MNISCIIVNYNSEKFLHNCLLSLKDNLCNVSYEIIIVNNDEKALANTIGKDISNFKLINNGVNNGFANACNIGAKVAEGKVCFFLNPDTECGNIDARTIITRLENPDIGIVAPRLVMRSGAVQPWSCGYDITLLDIIKNNLGIIRSRSLWENNSPTEAHWVSGGAFAIKRSDFEKLSGFDEKFFLYFEDVDLCVRLRSHGKKIFLLPEMQILHLGGESSSDASKQKKFYYRSQDYYFKKHRGHLEFFLMKLFRNIFSVLSPQK